MKIKTGLVAAFLLSSLCSPCFAELLMTLRLEHASILQLERLDASLTVENTSQAPLVIMPGSDRNNAVVRFVIEKKRFEPLAMVGKEPLIEKLEVFPDKKATVTLDLSLWYMMSRDGRYIVHAEIDWQGETYKSNAEMVDVVRGIELLRVRKSVAGAGNKARTYRLRYWKRKKAEQLFLCIDDEAAGINYGVFRLGPVIRMKKPSLKVDSLGYVTVIHQSGPDQFTRSGLLSSRAGVKFIGQVRELEDGRPYPVRVEPPDVELPPDDGAKR